MTGVLIFWSLAYDLAGPHFIRSTDLSERARFQELIHRVRNRDQEAARELTATYEAAIRRIVRVRLRDARLRQLLDSTDVCQSVLGSFFVRAALGQYELETPDQLIRLLSTMARNKLANQAERLRAQRRDIRRETSVGDADVQLLDREPDPSQQVCARELLEQVQRRLSREERRLAEQRAQGRTWSQIAEELNSSPDALRKQFERALNRTMTELGMDDSCHA